MSGTSLDGLDIAYVEFIKKEMALPFWDHAKHKIHRRMGEKLHSLSEKAHLTLVK